MESTFPFGPVLQVPDTAAARGWLCRELRFCGGPGGALENGSCALYLCGGPGGILPAPAAGAYYTGLAHVALRCHNIADALAHCKSRGLAPLLQNGRWLHNPKVFGAGEYYFNVPAPFGLTVELSQRVQAPGGAPGVPFEGLDHLGVPCAELDAELGFLREMGFAPLFEPVENYNEREGRIRCAMVRREALVLEVYQFLDRMPAPMPENAVLKGVFFAEDAVSPGGLRFLKKRCE